MAWKLRWWLAGYIIVLVVALTVVFGAPYPITPAVACEAGSDAILRVDDFSQIPTLVLEDAQGISRTIYERDQSRANELTCQLAATYLAAKDKDVIVIFSPGGWGWDPVSEIPGWKTILSGIETTLKSYGHNTLVIDHKRTAHTLTGTIGETEVMLGVYPYKVEELVARVDFLIRHFPKLRIILSGESQGAAISEEVVQRFKDNSRVFSIQSGPPFWHVSHPFERSLVIDNNGIQPDAFTSGDWIVITRANLEAAFGIYRGSRGNILLYIGAPGHDYSWEYPAVRQQITDFLSQHFAAPLSE
jgi:hypothetical protein